LENQPYSPSPNVAEDHQTKNAKAIVEKDEQLFRESELDEQFETVFTDLITMNQSDTNWLVISKS